MLIQTVKMYYWKRKCIKNVIKCSKAVICKSGKVVSHLHCSDIRQNKKGSELVYNEGSGKEGKIVNEELKQIDMLNLSVGSLLSEEIRVNPSNPKRAKKCTSCFWNE